MRKKLGSLKDLAEEMNVPVSTINTWRRRNDIPDYIFKRVGGTVFVKWEKYDKWVEEE